MEYTQKDENTHTRTHTHTQSFIDRHNSYTQIYSYTFKRKSCSLWFCHEIDGKSLEELILFFKEKPYILYIIKEVPAVIYHIIYIIYKIIYNIYNIIYNIYNI